MKSKLLLILFLLVTFACHAGDGKPVADKTGKLPVFGYLPLWKMPYTPDWSKLTHIIFAFGQIESGGELNLQRVERNKQLIADAKANGVKAILSVGGGWMKPGVSFSAVILDETSRKKLAENLVKAVRDYELDGLDIDFEEWKGGPGGSGDGDDKRAEALEELYKELRKDLGKDLILSAAITASWSRGAGSWGLYNCFKPSMHEHLDYVYPMIYSLTGTWKGSKVGQHASIEAFHSSIDHWLANQKIPKEKLVPGVPFHGYLFKSETNNAGSEQLSYAEILERYPDADAHLKDEVKDEKGILYHNGIPTITYKTEYIRDHQLGGVMIWELTSDTKDEEKSLLKAIDEVVRR
jgi:chitinase